MCLKKTVEIGLLRDVFGCWGDVFVRFFLLTVCALMFFWGARPVCEDCLEMVLFLILVGDKKGTLEFFM